MAANNQKKFKKKKEIPGILQGKKNRKQRDKSQGIKKGRKSIAKTGCNQG